MYMKEVVTLHVPSAINVEEEVVLLVLIQILEPLLGNLSDFMPPGSQVLRHALRIRRHPLPLVVHRVLRY